MPHLSIFERISHFHNLSKLVLVQRLAQEIYNIRIFQLGICTLIKKWLRFESTQPRYNMNKILISEVGLLSINKLLLSNPFITCA